jgi:hypothetical protein
MPLALTVFGIAARGESPLFCYAFLRDVRGSGAYAKPNVPKDKRPDGITRLAIETFDDIELVCWDKILEDGEAITLLDNFARGQFSVAAECPIEASTDLVGDISEPSIIREGRNWIRSSGTGVLWCRSLVISDRIDAISEYLVKSQGIGRAPAALLKIIELIAIHSGLGDTFKDGRRIGLVDRFNREESVLSFCGPLLVVVPEKPDFRSKQAMLRCHVQRLYAGLDRALTLHI